jgi:DNA polymerase III delta subunit
MTAEELFERTKKGKLPASLLLQGEDVYLAREWKKLLRSSGYEITDADLKKGGPDASIEELGQGGSLFSSRTLLWLKKPTAPSQWKADNKALWKRMIGRADGESLVVVLQAASDKRVNWSALALSETVVFHVDPARKGSWIKRMNDSRGSPLSVDKLQFLASFEEDLMTVDNWVELWSLGGDVWAEGTLGYKAGARSTESRERMPENPAFAWVDAVLRGDRTQSTKLLRHLWDDGQEPLQLLALLSKSVRILASLEDGGKAAGQPEFLINKLRGLARQGRSTRGRKLLRDCAELDRQLKSTTIHPFAALMRL